MRGSVAIITGPSAEPISLVEARAHLRLDASGTPATHPDDDLLAIYIAAAREHVEARTGRALMAQTIEIRRDAFPARGERLEILRSPVSALSSIKYDDATTEEETTLSSATYAADLVAEPAVVAMRPGYSWPATLDIPGAVRIRAVVGYASAAAIPAPLRTAVLYLTAHFYETRIPVAKLGAAEMPFAVSALCSPHVVWWF